VDLVHNTHSAFNRWYDIYIYIYQLSWKFNKIIYNPSYTIQFSRGGQIYRTRPKPDKPDKKYNVRAGVGRSMGVKIWKISLTRILMVGFGFINKPPMKTESDRSQVVRKNSRHIYKLHTCLLPDILFISHVKSHPKFREAKKAMP
jgi:hypothetical protein